MQTLTESLALIPHLILDPNDFRSSEKRSWHKIPKREQAAYWEQSFKEAGIENIRRLESHSWLVALRDISDERVLKQLLSRLWQRLPEDNKTWERWVHSTMGGLSLLHDGEIIFAAECCSDLSNLKDWQRAANSQEAKWQMLWNGHPWLYSRYENGLIFLTDYMESEPNSLTAAKYAIQSKLFKEIVSQAEQDLMEFGQRFNTVWLAEKK